MRGFVSLSQWSSEWVSSFFLICPTVEKFIFYNVFLFWSDQMGFSLFFLPRRSQIGRKIPFNYSYFLTNFIDISLCADPILWQYTAGRSPLSQPPKPLVAIRSSCGFSYLRPGVFHISLRTHKTQYTQPRRWKKENKHGLGLAPSIRREKFVILS